MIDVKIDTEKEIIEIYGTKYDFSVFVELGCSFPNMIGQILLVKKKEDSVITLIRVDKDQLVDRFDY